MFKLKTKPAKSQSEIIQEIHEAFYTEVDSLLAEAKITRSTKTQKADVMARADRLARIGFSNTKTGHEAWEEAMRIELIQRENRAKRELAEAIGFFSQFYPMYKFITVESVKKICKKYGLVLGESFDYIGDIPEKNLLEIEEFAKSKKNNYYHVREYSEPIHQNPYHDPKSQEELDELFVKEYYLDDVLCDSDVKAVLMKKYEMNWGDLMEKIIISNAFISDRFFIVAPKDEFDLTNKTIEDDEIKTIPVQDPIVLKEVFYNKTRYFLVVTAWGDEASDELIVNQNHN